MYMYLSNLIFLFHTVSCRSLFFIPFDLWPAHFALGPEIKGEKNLIHNLQYGPQTRLVGGSSMKERILTGILHIAILGTT